MVKSFQEFLNEAVKIPDVLDNSKVLELYRYYTGYLTTIDATQLDSLLYYKGMGDEHINSLGHLNINKALRNLQSTFRGTMPLSILDTDSTMKDLNLKIPLSKHITNIRSVLKKTTSAPFSFYVYRGVPKEILDSIRSKTKLESGFMSTTLKPEIAKKFGSGNILKIKIKKGFTKGIFIPSLQDEKYVLGSELEYLIKDNMMYQYINDVKDSQYNMIEVELK